MAYTPSCDLGADATLSIRDVHLLAASTGVLWDDNHHDITAAAARTGCSILAPTNEPDV